VNRAAHWFTWIPALLTLAGGVALRDCVLLASSGLLALAGFTRRMDLDSPMNPLSAALRCVRAGLGALLAAALLTLALIGIWLEWWQPANDSQAAVAILLLASTMVLSVRHAARSNIVDAPPRCAVLLLAGLTTLAMEAWGVQLVCCLAAAAAALYLGWRGVSLSCREAHFLLRAAD
jgi:hypothetical protein